MTMSANQNPRGGHAPPTTGTNPPPTANQAPLGARTPSQPCHPPNQIQRIHLEGAISEVCGHIHDLVGICCADLFTTTT